MFNRLLRSVRKPDAEALCGRPVTDRSPHKRFGGHSSRCGPRKPPSCSRMRDRYREVWMELCTHLHEWLLKAKTNPLHERGPDLEKIKPVRRGDPNGQGPA